MKYIVRCNYFGTVNVIVEADSINDAEDKAYRKIDSTPFDDLFPDANWKTDIIEGCLEG